MKEQIFEKETDQTIAKKKVRPTFGCTISYDCSSNDVYSQTRL